MIKLLDDTMRVAMSDLYYMKRNIWILLATSLITPLLYLVAFGFGLGSTGVKMEGYDYIAFMIPGVVAVTTLTSSFTSIANKLMIQKRFYESFDELMLCPVSKTSIILGKAVLGITKGSLCGLLLMVLGYFLSGDMRISVWLILMVVSSTFVFSMLGVAAGMIVKDLPRMNAFNSFVILPMTFLCGTMFSLSTMPDAVRYVIEALPLTHATECIRALSLGTEFPWLSLLAMALFGIAFYLIAQYALRRSNRSLFSRLAALLHGGFGGLDPHLDEAIPGLLAALGRRFRVHLPSDLREVRLQLHSAAVQRFGVLRLRRPLQIRLPFGGVPLLGTVQIELGEAVHRPRAPRLQEPVFGGVEVPGGQSPARHTMLPEIGHRSPVASLSPLPEPCRGKRRALLHPVPVIVHDPDVAAGGGVAGLRGA